MIINPSTVTKKTNKIVEVIEEQSTESAEGDASAYVYSTTTNSSKGMSMITVYDNTGKKVARKKVLLKNLKDFTSTKFGARVKEDEAATEVTIEEVIESEWQGLLITVPTGYAELHQGRLEIAVMGYVDKVYAEIEAKGEGQPALPIPYANGDDQNLDFPSDMYDSTGFIPIFSTMMQEMALINLEIFNHNWRVTPTGIGTYSGRSLGQAYGPILYNLISGFSADWNQFAPATYDGVQTVFLPKFANNDNLGGFFQFTYNRAAFISAFDGNDADVAIAQDGSVWKDAVGTGTQVTAAVPGGATTTTMYKAGLNLTSAKGGAYTVQSQISMPSA